ncbi:hypothetical protein HDU91_001622 [Kappamyces sp. JEL0680]|nr:hypothetical protein HDU91_001622 [Kappamyces sp. JEL0680]
MDAITATGAESLLHANGKPRKKEGIVKRFIRKGLKGEYLTCRICLQEDHRLQMISPCACKGTSEFVHKSCLSKWRSIDGASRFRCEICHSHYKFCRSWAKAGLIRLGCWAAILVYAYFLLYISQWIVKWVGLTPSTSRLAAQGWQDAVPFLATGLKIWFQHVHIGPMALFISPCVSLKKNRKGFGTFSKWIAVWALSFYAAGLHPNLALLSDLLFVVLTGYGVIRTLRHSFSTAQTLAPTVAVVLVDLHRLQN